MPERAVMLRWASPPAAGDAISCHAHDAQNAAHASFGLPCPIAWPLWRAGFTEPGSTNRRRPSLLGHLWPHGICPFWLETTG